ncbi:unnamed protein product [Ectocarpus sp. 12 AP-2014]
MRRVKSKSHVCRCFFSLHEIPHPTARGTDFLSEARLLLCTRNRDFAYYSKEIDLVREMVIALAVPIAVQQPLPAPPVMQGARGARVFLVHAEEMRETFRGNKQNTSRRPVGILWGATHPSAKKTVSSFR